MKLNHVSGGMRLAALTLAVLTAVGCNRMVQPASAQVPTKRPQKLPPLQIPTGPSGDQIRLGQQIFQHTPQYAAAYVGNQMKCADCHLQGGRAPYSAPLVGVPGLFPSYNQRAGRVITFVERLQECFVRSENGKPLAAGTPEMTALLAYLDFISQDQPKGQPYQGRGLVKLPALQGNPERGAAIYADQCSACHGDEGAGMLPLFPPLWGPTSFNDGAGMSHVEKMAAFVQHNMPQDSPGSLSAQEAYDVSAYVDSKPRPTMDPSYKKY